MSLSVRKRRSSFTTSRSRRSDSSSMTSEAIRSEEHTSELQSQSNLVCRLLLEKKKSAEYSAELLGGLRHRPSDADRIRVLGACASCTAPRRCAVVHLYVHVRVEDLLATHGAGR